jgi:hypothetical protein
LAWLAPFTSRNASGRQERFDLRDLYLQWVANVRGENARDVFIQLRPLMAQCHHHCCNHWQNQLQLPHVRVQAQRYFIPFRFAFGA